MTLLLRRRCARREGLAPSNLTRNGHPISIAAGKGCALLLMVLFAGPAGAQTSPSVPDATGQQPERVAPLHVRELDPIVVRQRPVEIVLHTPDGRAVHTGQYLDLFGWAAPEEVCDAAREAGSAGGRAAQKRLTSPSRVEGVEEGQGGERVGSFAGGPQSGSEGLPDQQGESIEEEPASENPASPVRRASSQIIGGGVPGVILLPGVSDARPDSAQAESKTIHRERIRGALPDAVVVPGLMGERTVILRERPPEIIDLAVDGYPHASRHTTSAVIQQRAKSVGYGMSGKAVREVQGHLRDAGFLIDVDGVFGLKTREAVLGFQRQYNRDYPEALIEVDGIVGQETRGALREVLRGR